MVNGAGQRAPELWFLTGSQHLYGKETLDQVAKNSRQIAEALHGSGRLPASVVWKPILTGPDEIEKVCLEANSAPECAGVITWMHTFSPAKMWIAGLTRLQKPLAHLHTQHNQELPWGDIDMDFMNLNQSAHGDREYGFIGARLRLNRKIVVGHYQDPEVVDELAGWSRSAVAMAESRQLKVARFGGMNMREVAVTGGDRVEAQIKLGWSINGYGVGDLAARIAEVLDGSPAETAGVQTGDRLLTIQGRPIATLDAAHRAVAEVTPGDAVTITVRRDGQDAEPTLTIRAAEGF